MAIVDENIRGRIGNSVFYRVGPATRVRSVTSSYTDANTTRQQESRSRLRVAVRFYQRLVEVELQKPWFLVAQGSGKSGYNLFMKLNMMVFKPNGRIGDFARLQLTIGRLQKANHLVACVGEQDMVSLTWERGRVFLPRGREMSWWLSCFMPIVLFLRNILRRVGRHEGPGEQLFVCSVNEARRLICIASSGRKTGKLIPRVNTLRLYDFRLKNSGIR